MNKLIPILVVIVILVALAAVAIESDSRSQEEDYVLDLLEDELQELDSFESGDLDSLLVLNQ